MLRAGHHTVPRQACHLVNVLSKACLGINSRSAFCAWNKLIRLVLGTCNGLGGELHTQTGVVMIASVLCLGNQGQKLTSCKLGSYLCSQHLRGGGRRIATSSESAWARVRPCIDKQKAQHMRLGRWLRCHCASLRTCVWITAHPHKPGSVLGWGVGEQEDCWTC